MKLQRDLVSILGICGSLSAACWAAPTGAAQWFPNKAVLARLAPATSDGKYQIRPPQGYTLLTQPGPGGTHADAWVGAFREDRSRPLIALMVITPAAGEKNVHTLQQFGARVLASVEHSRKDWKQSPTEQGRVNGLTFLRTRWQGTDAETGKAMSGFSYVTKDGNTFIQLSSQDFAPYQKEALSLAEASALTFKKP